MRISCLDSIWVSLLSHERSLCSICRNDALIYDLRKVFDFSRCNLTKRLNEILEEAAAEFDPRVIFMRVECPKYPEFCITRQKMEYPFIKIVHTPEQVQRPTRNSAVLHALLPWFLWQPAS